MEEQRKTQADLAGMLGVSTASISRLFNGDRELHISEISRIANWLNTSLTFVLQENLVQQPMVITCSRRIEFDAGHRIMEHESKCKYLHGHRYALEATFVANDLDKLGRVIDFGTIRDVLGKWIDEHWDHTTILCDKDQELGKAIAVKTGQKIYYMDKNPTAENMAEYLLNNVCPKLFGGMNAKCSRIRLYETPNCYADAGI